MPLNCDPGAVVEIRFQTAFGAPTFTYRFLTVAEVFERKRHIATARNNDADDERRRDALFAALAVGLTGWRNLTDPNGEAVPFAGKADPIALAATWDDMLAIYDVLIPAVRLAEADRKKSQPSSESGQASDSATPA